MSQLSAAQSSVLTAPASATTPPLPHPTACPSWCKSRSHRMDHDFGPTGTWHWSPQYTVGNPQPWGDGGDVVLTAELVVGDEDDQQGETSLYIQGATEIDLSPAEADIFIANMQAFVDTLKVLRGQMGAGRVEQQAKQLAAA